MSADLDPWELLECGAISTDYRAVESLGGRCDDQIMGTTRFALGSDLDKQFGVSFGNFEVIVEGGNRGDDIINVSGTKCPTPPLRQQRSGAQFRDGHCSDSDVVTVINERIKLVTLAA